MGKNIGIEHALVGFLIQLSDEMRFFRHMLLRKDIWLFEA